MYRRARVMALFVLSVVLGCERTEEPLPVATHSVSYANPANQEQLAAELTKANVPYDVVFERGREQLRVAETHLAAFTAVQERLFGPELPSGRNLRLDPERQQQFKLWLSGNGIPFKEVAKPDGNYIVWEATDDKSVRSWVQFPSFYDNPEAFERKTQ